MPSLFVTNVLLTASEDGRAATRLRFRKALNLQAFLTLPGDWHPVEKLGKMIG